MVNYLERHQRDNRMFAVKFISLKMRTGKAKQKSEELSVIIFFKVFGDYTAMRLVWMES